MIRPDDGHFEGLEKERIDMFNLPENINKRERIVRGTIGALLIIFALLGLGQVFSIIMGIVLIAYAAISYCGIVHVIEKFKLDSGGSSTPSSESKH